MAFKLRPNALQKLARKRRAEIYPLGTVAYYGPDDRRASKLAAGVIPAKGAKASSLERWFSETGDIRLDPRVAREVATFFERHGVRQVVITDRIIGCPHEEEVDYPEGESCPQCPFWKGRDRWTGELEN